MKYIFLQIDLDKIRLFYNFTNCFFYNKNVKRYFQFKMDITIDFTEQKHHKVAQLSEHPYLRSITFIIPFFEQLSHNFSILWDYITYLNDKPLVKIFVKPKGQQIKPKYKTVAVGGTFDHLHIGHQMLLLYAALSAEKKVIIGVTSEVMLEKKINKQITQSLLMRTNQVRDFIKTFKPHVQLELVQLKDPYGPTVTDDNIDAIIVTPQTLKMGETINQKRKQKGFHPLVIQNCPIMAPVHHLTSLKEIENKISSTQIRNHILAKNGLTIDKFVKYQQIWMEMVVRINKVAGNSQDSNHLVNRKWWDIVVKYYSQYWRYYHTNHHLNRMFTELSATPEMGYEKLSEVDKIVLEVSIFFHDIIYRPDIKTNEQDSANFAESFINQIWNGEGKDEIKNQIISKVKAAILVTQCHKPNTQVQKILCDLDMSILDLDLQKYKVFAFNVQREYRPLHKEAYAEKRVQFLQKIQGTYKFTWRKGDNCDSNIKWEIEHWKQQKSE